jgi:FMN phosphatase YigB (HAD superfamily)
MIRGYEMIIFDVGNTIIHDEPSERLYLYYVYQYLHEIWPTLTVEKYFEYRLALLREGDTSWVHTLGRDVAAARWPGLSDEAWRRVLSCWQRLTHPVAGAVESLRWLRGNVRLAILANQPRQLLDWLRDSGIMEWFEFVALDSVVGLTKPDPEFWRWALVRAQLPPERILCVGDRIDHDIYPAGQLGMHTAWIRHSPVDLPAMVEPREWCDHYLKSVVAIGTHNQHLYVPTLARPEPIFTASSVRELFFG